MENASKALLIAGGILIAIMILSLLLSMYGRVANIHKTEEEKTRLEQLAEFNAQYEAYNKKLMYGVDVKTLTNKVTEYNANNSDPITLDAPSINEDEYTKLYKCTKMEYSSQGKVNYIKIEPYS